MDLREIELFSISSFVSREIEPLVDEVGDSNEREKCAVYFLEFKSRDIFQILTCSHFYRVDCIDEWLMNRVSCPLYRCDFS